MLSGRSLGGSGTVRGAEVHLQATSPLKPEVNGVEQVLVQDQPSGSLPRPSHHMTRHMTPRRLPCGLKRGRTLTSSTLKGDAAGLLHLAAVGVDAGGGGGGGGSAATQRRPTTFFCRILWSRFRSGGDIAEEERGVGRLSL